MKFNLITLCSAVLLLAGHVSAQEWAPAGDKIRTRWAEEVSPANVHKEYPRPQMVRPEWKSLNGLWEYSITGKADPKPEAFEGRILVPFPVESSLSGVGRKLKADDALWYKTTFKVPGGWKGKRLMLNFEAVDWRADVFVNDILVGTHTGGYTHFSFDVTPYVNGGTNTLVLKVLDATDNDLQPRGKQVSNPKGIWYTAVSGIWQSVWMEPVSKSHITDYDVVSNIKDGTVDVTVSTEGVQEGDVVKVFLKDGGIGYSTESAQAAAVAKDGLYAVLASGMTVPGGTVTLNVRDPKLWSPDRPYLYGLDIQILRGGKIIDRVAAYTAIREVGAYIKNKNTKLLGLNGKAIFQFGPLDQGWWPDGLYTAPTDEALEFDIRKTKDFGYNMIRKHVKVEPSRWYYHCDRLGMIVWQDMPSFSGNSKNVWGMYYYGEGTDFPATLEAKANYYKEWGEIIGQLKKFQCIAVWVPFNEAWSQFDTKDVVAFTYSCDPTRLVNQSSGGNWEVGVGDILDNHHYPWPAMRMWDKEMINVLGEYGGIGFPVAGHLWQADRNWGYVQYKSGEDVLKEYEGFADNLMLIIRQGCSAAVYTQTTDVEGEVNGLMTYDREIIKMDEARLREVNLKVIASMPIE
ncbi:MAG: beta-galactosidase [Bacteroidales bacterium]|nr:beta-galactosidase [Bacteroidales bacterium]